jgi:HEAT repeat protein
LLQALDDSDTRVRQFTIWALGRSGDAAAIEPLTALLNSEDAVICQSAITALSTLKATGIEDQLMACLSSPHSYVVYTAALFLFHLKETKALPALLDAFTRVDDTYAYAFAHLLCEIGGPEIVDLALERLAEFPRERSWRLIEIFAQFPDPRIVEPLLGLLDAHVTYGYAYAQQLKLVRLLEKLADARAIEPLCEMLHHTSSTLQDAVIQALDMLQRLPHSLMS